METKGIKIVPLRGELFGAEVHGVTFSSDYKPAVIQRIRQALNDHQVSLFWR